MKKIMLIDDMDIFNFIMKKLIDSVDPIHQVHDFTNAELALQSLADIDPNVIFLDLNMPILNGWDFLEGMRARNMDYKVYILTSSTSELDRQRSEAYKNVVSFLIKPVGEEKIAHILETV
jgi:CheY-like chemotaxis protein